MREFMQNNIFLAGFSSFGSSSLVDICFGVLIFYCVFLHKIIVFQNILHAFIREELPNFNIIFLLNFCEGKFNLQSNFY